MIKYSAVIFDFDGTICDTGEGILKSAKYALDAFGYETPENERELSFFIGPPLLVTFQEKYGASPEGAEKLVAKYRERYTNIGLYESELYENIEELLIALKKDNIKIGIASSKPVEYINVLLEKLGIIKYFDCVCGVSFKADCETKASIISRCLKELDVTSKEAMVVGDRNYDILGAKNNMITSVGVLWGYGNKFEFIEAGADFIIDKIFDVESIALGFYEETIEKSGIFSGKIITVHKDKITLVDKSEREREVVEHNGGVSVVGLTDNNEILMVRQFRYAKGEVLFELPAGKLEKGEDPLEAGKREFLEECGTTAKNFFELGKVYPTPAYDSETIHIYGATDLEFSENHLDDGEFLDVYRIPFDEAVSRVMSGEFKDAKTIIGILKIKEMKENGSLS